VEILGVCPYFDIALLKVKGFKTKAFLKLHLNTYKINPGEESFAIGFPLGQENMKITKGVISGQQDNYYQTDTPINPGNSGGPLIHNGKVIGINAAGIDTAENIGFAVPISRYYMILDEIKKSKLIMYPNNLFEYQKTGEEYKRCSGSKCIGGVIVTKIYEDSIMMKSKIKEGDLLCSINDVHIDHYANMDETWMGQKMNLDNKLSSLKLNSEVKLDFWHCGKMYTDNLLMSENKGSIRIVYPNYEKLEYLVFGGFVFMNLTLNHLKKEKFLTQENFQYLIRSNQSECRVILVNILLESKVSNLNIFKKGDILKRINDTPIRTLKDVKKAISKKVRNEICEDIICFENERNKKVYFDYSKVEKENIKLKGIYKYV
jgi:serine protease Do